MGCEEEKDRELVWRANQQEDRQVQLVKSIIFVMKDKYLQQIEIALPLNNSPDK